MNDKEVIEKRMHDDPKESINLHSKCLYCNKKFYILTKCKCDGYYCSKHIHGHECTFNYKTLRNTMIKVEAQKIEKI